MKKKLLSVLLSTAMVASLLVGCGGTTEEATPAEEATTEEAPAEETEEVLGTSDPAEVQEYVKDWDAFFETADKMKEARYAMLSGPDDIKYAIWDQQTQPSAIRSGFAGIPVLLGKSFAYFSSMASHGMVAAFFTHLFSGFILNPNGWLKSARPN